MLRSRQREMMEDPDMPEDVLDATHRGLTRLHFWLGNHAAVLRALRRGPHPVRRVLDIGCGRGALLMEIRRRFGAEVVGVDLRPPRETTAAVPIIAADAVRDTLPVCDVAVAVCLAHELSDVDLIGLIHNVGRSCRRLILLDPVRHRLPLLLYRIFVAPLVYRIIAIDGLQSIRRSYTPGELRDLVGRALEGTAATVRHTVAPLYARQMVDIQY